MKYRLILLAVTVVMAASLMLGQNRRQHLNPMIDLLEQHKVIAGIVPAPYPRVPSEGPAASSARPPGPPEASPAPPAPDACGVVPAPRGEFPQRGAGGGGGERRGNDGRGAGARGPAAGAPPQAANMEEAAKMTLRYKAADFLNGSMEGGVDNQIAGFSEFMKTLGAAGALVKTPYSRLSHPYYLKTPRIATNPTKAIENISSQLNTGLSGVIFVAVGCAREVQLGLAAMRPKSMGGTRPANYGDAPAYWGLTPQQYEQKADVWGLNPNGELVSWVIIESREGLRNVREIAKEKGIGVLIPGSGTLSGVLRNDPDPEAWEKAQQTVLAACKEFNVNCGFPASTPEVLEMRMKQGFNVFVLQGWNEQAFNTIAHARRLGERPAENQ